MKYYLTLMLLACFVCNAQTQPYATPLDPTFYARITEAETTNTSSYLINENFEAGTIPSGWTVAGNTASWNYTPALVGNYSMRADPNWGSAYVTFTDQSSAVYVKMRIKTPTAPSSSSSTPQLVLQSGATVLMEVHLYIPTSPINVGFKVNGSTTTSSQTLSTSTTYYLWLKWIPSGTCELAISSSNSKPSSDSGGNVYLTGTAASTTPANRLYFQDNGSSYSIYDDVQISASPIP